jgi:membrane associated rhomboid family serine protease
MSPYVGYGYGLPNGVKYLLISNVAVFALMVIAPRVIPYQTFGLIPYAVNQDFTVWQFFTYMFLHGGFGHIFWNMFGLWMFGTELEYNWGTRDFLKFYFACGIGGGILVWLTSFVGLSSATAVTVGASGAIFGLLVAYGLMWPDRMIYIFGILPMRALQFVIIYGAIQIFQGFTGTGGNVAVFAHIGGGLTGLVYLKWGWRIQVYLEHFMRRLKRRNFKVVQGGKRREEDRRPDSDDEVDRILDKIAREGMDSLDDRERRVLKRASERKGRS